MGDPGDEPDLAGCGDPQGRHRLYEMGDRLRRGAGRRTRCRGPLHSTLGALLRQRADGREKKRSVVFAARHRRPCRQEGRDHRARSAEPLRMLSAQHHGRPVRAYRRDRPSATSRRCTTPSTANIEEADPIGAYTKHVRNIVHIHISENDRGVPGRGNIPWAETFAAIRKSGYDDWLTIEVVRPRAEGSRRRHESLARFRREPGSGLSRRLQAYQERLEKAAAAARA